MKINFKKILRSSLLAASLIIPSVAITAPILTSCSSSEPTPPHQGGSGSGSGDHNKPDQGGSGSGDHNNPDQGTSGDESSKPNSSKPKINFTSSLLKEPPSSESNSDFQKGNSIYISKNKELVQLIKDIDQGKYRLNNDDQSPITYEVTLEIIDEFYVGQFGFDLDKPFDFNNNYYKKLGQEGQNTVMKFRFKREVFQQNHNDGIFYSVPVDEELYGITSAGGNYKDFYMVILPSFNDTASSGIWGSLGRSIERSAFLLELINNNVSLRYYSSSVADEEEQKFIDASLQDETILLDNPLANKIYIPQELGIWGQRAIGDYSVKKHINNIGTFSIKAID